MAPSRALHSPKNATSQIEAQHNGPNIIDTPDMVLDGSVSIRYKPVRRSLTGGWKACVFIIGDELSERLSYYGIASNLITYMTTVLHESLASSAKNTNNWIGVTLVVPVVGAFFADTCFGKYWTIAAVSVVYILGLVFLTLSVALRTFKPPACDADGFCPKASSRQLGFFFFSLYLISIGTGGVKPCLQAFGADQFDEEHTKEKEMKSSFFNWWYFGLCTGALLAFTVLVYIQDNVGWSIGFGIPAVAMTIALSLFLAGTKFYRHKIPGGSPLTRVAQVVVAAALKRNIPLPSSADLLYEMHGNESLRVGRRKLLHTNRLRFLDKAAILDSSECDNKTVQSPWMLCTVTQVEEVKLLLHIVPIWFGVLMYGVVFAQTSTLFTKQGSTMVRSMGPRFQIPAASLQSFPTIVILILLPIYDRLFVPVAQQFTGNQRGISMLQRIGMGLFLSVLSMVVAAVTEMRRLKAAVDHELLDKPQVTIPLSIFWLLPQYILIGISDVFAIVGQQEFFYDQVPDTMRSLGMALYLCAIGVGSFLSSLLITIVDSVTSHSGQTSWFVSNINRGHLDYFYWLLAAFSAVNLCLFILLARLYAYKETECISFSLVHQQHSLELVPVEQNRTV